MRPRSRVALASASLITRLRRAGRWVPRVAGVLMIMVGGYVAYYGWWEIRVLDGAAAEDPVVGAAAQVQGWLAGAVTALGPLGLVIILTVLIVLGLVVQRRRGARRLSDARKGL